MKIFFKKEIYFEVEIEDGSDRSLVSSALEELIDPSFEELVRKIKFHKEEISSLNQRIGKQVSISVLPKSEFLNRLNVK